MPTRDDHLRQWKHNRDFIPSIEHAFHDWIITATFYTALHAVDALLVHDKVPVHDHRSRNDALVTVNRYDRIWRSYQPLYNLSHRSVLC